MLRKLLLGASLICLSIFTTSHAVADYKVLLIADNHSLAAKKPLLKKAAKGTGVELEITSSRKLEADKAAEKFATADLVLFDAMAPMVVAESFGKYQDLLSRFKNTKFDLLRIDAPMGLVQGVSQEQRQAISAYYSNGGQKNFNNFIRYIGANLGDLDLAFEAPYILPTIGFYSPDLSPEDKAGQVTGDENKLFASLPSEKPVVAIAAHRSILETEQTQVVDAILAEIKHQGGAGFVFFYEGEDAEQPYWQKLKENGASEGTSPEKNSLIDSMINLRMIHYVEKRRSEFEKLGIPVIQALAYREGDEKKFDEAISGISAGMTPYFLVMPETTGMADSTIVSAQNQYHQQQPIDYQIEAVAARALNQAKLRYIDNSDKKVAVMIWNYPPGEKNVGAAFLNVPDSLENITQAMKADGYSIEPKDHDYFVEGAGRLLKPFYFQGESREENKDLLQGLIDDGMAGFLPLSVYQDWFSTLPEKVRSAITERWGDAKDHGMIREHQGELAFVVPRMNIGNVIVLQQPPRSDDKDEHADLYHSMTSPINHYYLAAYLYVREGFDADAIVHLGTHGSQEWLPGKERALSVYDPGNLAVGNLPVIYPYIMDNVGEAMQAKRRGRAIMVSHLTPGFAKAGLYADFSQFNQLYSDYLSLDEGETKDRTREKIEALLNELQLEQDLAFTPEQIAEDYEAYMTAVSDYIQEMSHAAQPLGLHSFGDTPEDAHLVTTLVQMLGEDFAQKAGQFERDENLALDAALVKRLHSDKLDELDGLQLTDIDGFALLWSTIVEVQAIELSDELSTYVEQGRKWYNNFRSQHEMKSLLDGLSGRYLPTGSGGDPIRNPEAIVTGKNLIGFNPARVPSQSAWETGKRLTEELIANHYAENGVYPDKLAFSLWSLETMRHHGVLEAQVMAAMGVKPVWDRRGMVTGTEVIPFSELKRPRVDVAVSATGLYRDAFPNVMLLLAKAVQQVAELKEDDSPFGANPIFANTETLKSQLKAKGVSEDEATYLSTVRLFSNDSGSYGTGLAETTLASDSWDEEGKLADLYFERMGYVFGADEKRWSEKVDSSLFDSPDGKGGGLYGQVLSGTDAVVFSRSTNLYGMLTRDDPFQYFGGVSLAVRHVDGLSDGEGPQMYVSNLRDAKNVKTETLKRFMAREMRTRAFHPRWIEQMQAEGYSGAVQMLDRINNFWGWAVVDPDSVTQDQWQQWYEVYVDDKYQMDMREWFENSNPHNLAQMIERMLEASRKDYWQADEEALKNLVQTYQELAAQYDIVSDNEKFNAFLETKSVEGQAQGFGLAPLPAPLSQETAPADAIAEPSAQSQQVQGQQLQKVEQPQEQNDDINTTLLMAALAMLLMMAIGAWREAQVRVLPAT